MRWCIEVIRVVALLRSSFAALSSVESVHGRALRFLQLFDWSSLQAHNLSRTLLPTYKLKVNTR